MKTRIFASILAALTVLAALASCGGTSTSKDGFEYAVEDGAAVITKYTGSASEVTVPAEIDGHKVIAVAKEAFLKCSALENVIIPSGVTAIREEAFSECSALTSVTLSDTVTTVESRAFVSCAALEKIDVDEKNGAFTSKDGVLFSKDGATLVLCPASKQKFAVPATVTAVGDTAFLGCTALESVALPDALTSIGARAFYDCSALTAIKIPAGVTSIGDGAFSGCVKLSGFEVDDGNGAFTALDGVLYSKDGSTLVACPGAKTAVTLGAGVTKVAEWAFPGCTPLKSIEVDPANAVYKSAGGMLLSKDGATLVFCPDLKKEIAVPDGVTTVGTLSFARSKTMRSVTLPASVTTIEKDAFLG